MPSNDIRKTSWRQVAVAAALVALVGPPAARAADDGQAPIWEGVTSVLGPVIGFGKDKDPSIDYRERGKLVLPPKIVLPAPSAAAGPGTPDWPVDPDVLKEKKEKAEKAKPDARVHYGRYVPPAIPPGSVVTMRSTAGQGESPPPPCPKDAAPGTCQRRSEQSNYGKPTMNFNPLTWVGLQKNAPVVLGPEPDRDWLTDPPKGLRAPVEGVGAKVEN
jgi:hypothetical protein